MHSAISLIREIALAALYVLRGNRDARKYITPENATPWISSAKSPRSAPPADMPVNVRQVPGTGIVVKDEEVQTEAGSTIETTVLHAGSDGRVLHLTDADRAAISDLGLDSVKAATVKPFWAKCVSSRDASNILQKQGNGKGLRERTLDKYWSAFARALGEEKRAGEKRPTPLEVEW